MAEEYISRKSVRDAIAALSIERFELSNAYRLYVEALDNVDKKVVKIPAADVEPVRHGRWCRIMLKTVGITVQNALHSQETERNTARTVAQRWMVARMYELPMMLLVAICLLIAWSRKETE